MIRLRHVGPDDWEAWRAVRQRSLRADPGAFAATAHQWLDRWDHELLWRERLAAVYCVVASVDGVDVGSAGLDLARAELVGMWVAAEHRGRGIGRGLVDAVVARADGPVRLRVMADNPQAVEFYEGCGFEPASADVDDEGCLSMERPGPDA